MFLVNRLFGISGPSPAPELTTIDGGSLFLVRPDTVKGSRECIFIDASISIRRSSQEFSYELVVTRTFQEGEEQLLEEDAENVEERAFLIDDSLFFSLGPTLDPSDSGKNALSFTWLDPDGGPEDEFEFVLLEGGGAAAGDAAKEFERLAWRCMWERREREAWPTDPAEAHKVEQTLDGEFKVARSKELLSPLTSPVKQKKAPLFRPPSFSDDEDEDVKPKPRVSALQAALAPTSTRDDSDSDSDEEIAAALTKVRISAPSSSSSTPAKPSSKTPSKPKSKLSNTITPPPSTSKPDKGKGRVQARSPSPPPAQPPQTLTVSKSADEDSIASVLGDLFIFDLGTSSFVVQEEGVTSSLHRLEDGSGYWLVVQGAKGPWVSQKLDAFQFAEKEQAMVFNYKSETPSEDGGEPIVQIYTWLVKFLTQENFETMQAAASMALYESRFGTGAWKKLKDEERLYQKQAYIEDAEMYGIEEENAEPEEEEAPFEEEEDEDEFSDDYEEESDEDEKAAYAGKVNRAKNSQLAVGYKEDLSFVVQGDMIGVFKQQREGGKKLKFMTNISNIATPDGKKFTPNKVMLHNQDTKMILQNPLAPGTLFGLDLETGKVVDEYKIGDHLDITAFLPDSKFAQTTQQQTFIGVSHNSAFRIDPRINGYKLDTTQQKVYASKTDFTVASTTEGGKIAIASAKGEIRLFDSLGKNAKTVLPALGDPIVGLDVSADGKWVLATTKTYLLLVDCVIPDGVGKFGGSSGFDRSFPKDSKPVPKRLQLRPEHAAHMDSLGTGGVNFTPAKFNAGLNETERTIVSSSGPFVIAWNFRHVKAGNVNNYTIRRFSDTVIADAFKFGGDREIIVTLPADVFVEEKKKLKAPTRDSMSRIVNTWEP